MKIPKAPDERLQFYQDVLGCCLATRQGRRDVYRVLKTYYLFGIRGIEGEDQARFNKILPHIDQVTSFMYDRSSLRFNIELSPSVNEDEIYKVPPLNEAITQEFRDGAGGSVFAHCTEWGYVYGSMFVKARWKRDRLQHFPIEPHNFGVYREDTAGLDNQEAFSHSYYITESQLRSELISGHHARAEQVLLNVQSSRKEETAATVGPIDRIIISAIQPDIQGNVRLWASDLDGMYRPRVQQPLIEMHELYVFDDETGDFQVVTLTDPLEIVWDRPLERMFLKGLPPFVQVCPTPAYDYFWGYSEVERLVPLQDLRNERMGQVRHMMGLQAKPPKSASGFTGAVDEIALTLDSQGGVLATDMPNAKVDTHAPDIPEDLFRDIREIDQMFDEVSGLPGVLQGRGEAGVRSSGHANTLKGLGGSRAKKRANTIEDSLSQLATLDLRLLQRYDTKKYREEKEGGVQFIAEQFTKDSTVVVDSHSNSPLFMEEQDARALELFKAKAIDREGLLRLLSVPMRELLIKNLKTKIEPAEAHAAEEERKLKLIQMTGGGHRGGATAAKK